MRNKFKIGTTVIVNGTGKEDPITKYIGQYATVIERDDGFLDYKVEFKSKKTDWLDEKFLRYP